MGLVERIKQIASGKERGSVVKPTRKLADVLSGSRILDILEGLRDQTPLEFSSQVVEDGKKIVIRVNWPTVVSQGKKGFTVSLTEESISFMGNTPNNHRHLEGMDMQDGELIENSLLEAFRSPSMV
ncbi:MAG: hypothetical protein A2700_03085 [Candidatus Blackburnbacteria bacterium RIFCSPHIGHO2_01_FULL_44_64]|nr:MAG: hypothetical protein A2700_03085 [Candidatus Blackburnbacteria bacterium RIFCSPHIGHO2_01_FULL_44_64]OGY10371.1 MAG: hypothetical protein A3D26_03610 [Candidatus Blackburnbacteria bacterium RIFCSPHIGHO2_02_FULL_44_20]OGY12118.1 MAG: hypothetical protein A3E16_00170 [Candidatus Blackburnbacteria bacterium RIFCSPHIGHO2_12_FULL_44_25]OGY13735.1 MAG: hypothetical protein A3A62_02895 [Candidatus Blackburnbacteria bacterium RIFCSPLOWO2_01_FULL_44_43]OGY16430.1 MAG: hypothetical protein A3H88_0